VPFEGVGEGLSGLKISGVGVAGSIATVGVVCGPGVAAGKHATMEIMINRYSAVRNENRINVLEDMKNSSI